ncbi:hypothetical protein L7F22_019728 [Adiantum nelumboides]|nr:hypothetical protein [Adiantum nelumboides]
MVKLPSMVLEALKTVIYPYLYNPSNLPLALTAPDSPTARELSWGDELDPKDHKELSQKLMEIVSGGDTVLKIINTIAVNDSPRTYFGTDFFRYVTVVENLSRRLC